MRKKPNLLPRMTQCASLLIEEPAVRKGAWRALMPTATAVWLEIGCGKGGFTAETAERNPDILYLALERVPDAMVVAMERVMERGLSNVRFIDGDAATLTAFFAPGEVDRIYINFCDPWPSNRHAKRRLTHPDFLNRYRAILSPGGEVHFKTDNHDLFSWSLFQFPKTGFSLSEVSYHLHGEGVCGVMTDYEAKFHAMGLPIHRCVARME